MDLTASERTRYNRTILLPEIGLKGQERLKHSRVLVVGMGGLGSPVCFYLAAAGVGFIGIVDSDTVEENNLQRQIIHREQMIGKKKVDSARQAMQELNSHLEIQTYPLRITEEAMVAEIVSGYELVIMAVDNLATRYVMNRVCLEQGRCCLEAGVAGYEGYVTAILPGKTPCFECLFPRKAPKEPSGIHELGILPTIPALLGSIQVTEALKLLLGIGAPLAGRLLKINLLEPTFQMIEITRRTDCPACSQIY